MDMRPPRTTLSHDPTLFRSGPLVRGEHVLDGEVVWYRAYAGAGQHRPDRGVELGEPRLAAEERLDADLVGGVVDSWRGVARSEEHTSELESRQYPVCCLLLE